MNWEMLGAIGEIVGAAGVILTLGYLARQIRTSNRIERRQSGEAAMDRISNFLARISADSSLARIWARGLQDMDELSAEEKTRLSTLFLDITYIWERIYYLDADGSMDAGLVATMDRARAEIVCAPGYRRWFAIRKKWLSEEFRRALEHDLESGADPVRPLEVELGRMHSTSADGA